MTLQTTITRRSFMKTMAASLASGGLMLQTSSTPATSNESQGWQIGCYTRPWDKHDYRVALDGMAEAGYQYAGFMTTNIKEWVMIRPDLALEAGVAMGEEARKRGLKVISIYGGDFKVTESVARGIEGLRRLIDHCGVCRCPHLLLGGTTDPTQHDAYYKVIKECCEYAREKGVSMSIKPHGGTNANGAQCRKIIESVGHSSFRLWYDPGNIFYYSEGRLDPVEDSATVNGLVSGVSVKDFMPPKEVLMTPGQGKVDFKRVFENLKKGGFTRGPLVVECLAPGDVAKINAEARKARLYLEKVLTV